jgi:hypothetical protein
MLAYLDYMVNTAGYLKRGDFLLFDGEKSFTTPAVKQFLEECGIFPFVLTPSMLHQFLNPADNNFHALLKLGYYRRLSRGNYSKLSIPEKFLMAKESYESIGSASIISMFKRCGLVETEEDKSSIVSNLMFEGMRALNRNQDFHKNNLGAYLEWCDQSNLSFLYDSLDANILRMNGMIQ